MSNNIIGNNPTLDFHVFKTFERPLGERIAGDKTHTLYRTESRKITLHETLKKTFKMRKRFKRNFSVFVCLLTDLRREFF